MNTRTFVANRAAGEQVRINIRAHADMKAVRKEKRNGRDVVIVPSATMPDGIVMNEIMYPKDEIAKSYKSLERTPAPFGHPTINGKFVSARDPEGLNQGWIGAWNENVRQEKGRVLLDKVIDVETANQSDAGKRVLSAIDKGEPISTSTGLLCMLEAANGDVDYNFTARDIAFDHDAILLDEDPAASPEQGVGMMVNAQGEHVELRVINSCVDDPFDQDIDWAGTRLIETVRRKQDATVWLELKDRILEALGFPKSERSTSTNTQENEMAVSDEQFAALSGKVDALSESLKPDALATAIGNAVAAAVKPLTDANEALVVANKAKDEDELKGLRETIVKANLLEEGEAAELTLNAARALAKKAQPGKAAPLNGAFKSTEGGASAFKLPEAK